MGDQQLWHTRFEVFGKVQGVFFRKYTQVKAEALNLRGYVRNTPRGTVVGVIEGNEMNVKRMKNWLSTVGSPKSKIQRAVWSDEKKIQSLGYTDFAIKKD